MNRKIVCGLAAASDTWGIERLWQFRGICGHACDMDQYGSGDRHHRGVRG